MHCCSVPEPQKKHREYYKNEIPTPNRPSVPLKKPLHNLQRPSLQRLSHTEPHAFNKIQNIPNDPHANIEAN